jgi:hypothetical protein
LPEVDFNLTLRKVHELAGAIVPRENLIVLGIGIAVLALVLFLWGGPIFSGLGAAVGFILQLLQIFFVGLKDLIVGAVLAAWSALIFVVACLIVTAFGLAGAAAIVAVAARLARAMLDSIKGLSVQLGQMGGGGSGGGKANSPRRGIPGTGCHALCSDCLHGDRGLPREILHHSVPGDLRDRSGGGQNNHAVQFANGQVQWHLSDDNHSGRSCSVYYRSFPSLDRSDDRASRDWPSLH